MNRLFKTKKEAISYLRESGDKVYNDASDDFLLDEAFSQHVFDYKYYNNHGNFKLINSTFDRTIDPKKLAKNHKNKIEDAILTMDKFYWALNERERNCKEAVFIDLISYCKQMLDEFQEVLDN